MTGKRLPRGEQGYLGSENFTDFARFFFASFPDREVDVVLDQGQLDADSMHTTTSRYSDSHGEQRIAVPVTGESEFYNRIDVTKTKNIPVPTAENLPMKIIYHDYKHELKMLRDCCQPSSGLLQLQDLVQAGELQYINQTLDDITNNLIQQLMKDNLGLYHFIQSCLTPIMYLLKRQQNLDDFFSSISFKYEGVVQTIENRFNQVKKSLSKKTSSSQYKMTLHLLNKLIDE